MAAIIYPYHDDGYDVCDTRTENAPTLGGGLRIKKLPR